MATTKNITMKQFNGTDYDTLYPKTIASQVEGIYSKEEILSNVTKVLFGLDSASVPNDAFAWIGKFNEYWWSAKTPEIYEYIQKNVDMDQRAFLKYGSKNYSVQYSSKISVNKDTGVITLVDPQTLPMPSGSAKSYCQTVASNLLAVVPCYITGCGAGSYSGDISANVYYIPSNATKESYLSDTIAVDTQGDNLWSCYINNSSTIEVPAKLVTSVYTKTHEAGDVIYVHSPNRNSYPDSGTVDGVAYEYLGIPFDNIVVASKIAVGSYNGTGTYGEDTPNSLTFNFIPKVLIVGGNNTASGWQRGCFPWVNGVTKGLIGFASVSSIYTVDITWNDTTVSWYGSDAASQLNESGKTYYYIAIG